MCVYEGTGKNLKIFQNDFFSLFVASLLACLLACLLVGWLAGCYIMHAVEKFTLCYLLYIIILFIITIYYLLFVYATTDFPEPSEA